MKEPVRSPRNKRVAAAARLHRARERAATGQSLLEGPVLLEAAIRSGIDLGTVFVHEDDSDSLELALRVGCDVIPVTQEVLDRLAPSQHPRGPVTVFEVPPSEPIEDRPVVVLWDIGDPGNAGTLIRSAAAFGFGVVVTPQTVDVWSPKVLRAAAGSHFDTPIQSSPDPIIELKGRGLTPIAAVVSGGRPPAALRALLRPAIVVGSEPHGLPEQVVAACEERVTIPMRATESLNVGVAGAILMYEASDRFE